MWERISALGARLGCHQRADRSFYWKGKKFPVCARCTGVAIGQFLAMILWWFIKPSVIFCSFLCGSLMFDWAVQYAGIKESTNRRRLITGILGGYGLLSIQFKILSCIISLFKKSWKK